MLPRRPLVILIALSLLAGATLLRADRLTYTPDAAQPRDIALTPGVRAALGLPPASQPATPATAPATVPSTQPVPPVVVPPVTQPAGQTIFASATDDWSTLAKELRPFGTLALPCGAQWRGMLTLTVPCTVTAYGQGPRPVILAPVNSPAIFTATGTKLASLTLRNIACRPADPNAPRNEGIAIYGSIGTVLVDSCECGGFEQGAVFSGGHGAVTIRNCWIHDTWADYSQPGKLFRGQLVYLQLQATAKPTVIDQCLLSNAGTAGGRKPWGYTHNLYSQHDGPGVVITDTVFAGAAAGAMQVRDGGTATRCMIHDAGVAFLISGKPFAAKDCLVVGGHRYNLPGSNPAGNMGACSYSALTLDNVRFLGAQGQSGGPGGTDMGCFMASRTYPPADNPATAAANVWAKGGYPGRVLFTGPVLARNWPGPVVSGDAPPARTANLTVRTDQAALGWLPAWRAKLANGTATAAEALAAQGVN